MPYNGSGVFQRLYNWVTDRNNGIKIRADRMDAELNGMATALSTCVTRDGQSPPTANLPMDGKRHTGVGAAQNPDEYATFQQLTDALSVTTIGDYLTTERAPGSAWLRRDGGVYAIATYPALAALITNRFAKPTGWATLTASTGKIMDDVTYGAGLYMILGDTGRIQTSPTGSVWTTQTTGTTEALVAGHFDNGTFVVVGVNGTIITSPDGETWTARTSGTSETLRGVAYGNSKWMVVGSEGTILVSTNNGASWSPRVVSAAGTAILKAVTYGGGLFVVVGESGKVLTTPDGDDWQSETFGSNAFNGVAYGNNRFVVAGGVVSLVSRTGSAWKQISSPGPAQDVAFGWGVFVMVCGSSPAATSLDGESWSLMSLQPAGSLNGIAFTPHASGFIAAVGVNSTTGGAVRATLPFDPDTHFQVPADNPDNGWIKALNV